ncbi:TPA: DNA cytosine methyltransferase, partial [Staphylococcus aureus]|nr:DNA cytosine methyltransferase [Staphylococcus aureus]HCU7745058.1 DNA cytosine methyltransferase [Staphylococcus aureus]HDH1940232.1 DNA cytosine methyltransferase [Staphylococcus aureus]HDH9800105.1 DNA cytosine methyltransferase [Staphylococcus aureus]HDJ6716582.1 DNA cytosine methyltransferase [Staphylococcus aureus]
MFSLNKKVIDRAMREKNIKTYTELADRTLLNKVQLSNMLNSEYSPIKSNVLSLMKELDLSFEEIIKKRNESVKKDLQLASLDIFEQLDLKFEDLDDVDYISENKKYKLEEYEDFSLFSPESCFNVIETFAGAGGLSLGLEKANLKTRIAIELDKYAAETLKVNIKDALIIQDDINNVLKVGFDSYGI